jgi:serine/threonine-protein phosphatase PP1 catalytic subunit
MTSAPVPDDDRAGRILATLNPERTPPRFTPIPLSPDDLHWLCATATPLVARDPILLKIPGPVNVLGDLHGNFYDLLLFLREGGAPPATSYLFLGNYVDRGHNRLETIAYLLALKVKFPNKIWLLRGSHETPELASLYGFKSDCSGDDALFDEFMTLFKNLPLAAVVGGRILCVHGGLSPNLTALGNFRDIQRPLDLPRSGLAVDLLFADANPSIDGFVISDRGNTHSFGADVIREFLHHYHYELLIRGNQCVQEGYEFNFGADQPIVTITSATDYCEEFANKGAMARIDVQLRCTFWKLEPQLLLRPWPVERPKKRK